MQKIEKSQPYSDYVSLKKYLEIQNGSAKINIIETMIDQLATNTSTLLATLGSTTSDIGKTELTLSITAESDDGTGIDNVGKVLEAYYITNSGEKKKAQKALTSTLHATPIAFGITDFYCWNFEDYSDPLLLDAEADGYISVRDAGANEIARIADETMVGSTDYYLSVGTVYGSFASNHVNARNSKLTLEYLTSWGKVKKAYCYFASDANTTTVVKFVDTAGKTIGDFYRARGLQASFALDANTGIFRITNAGKSATYYGIATLHRQALNSQYYLPKGAKAYLGKVKVYAPSGIELALNCTTPNQPMDVLTIKNVAGFEFDLLIPITEFNAKIARIGATDTDVFVVLTIIEVEG